MKRGSKVGIICCSNAQPFTNTDKINKLKDTLSELGLTAVLSDCVFFCKCSVWCIGQGESRSFDELL